ncbi:Tripartite ATP-independent periplasmic transporter, DctQ component [Alkaliphilus metalliredigens QYMF]|uniref:Tripartite ATP-independent periplasmic transporter, DctQ component n=1 Tax=Alkaliphilus metalliredigens (strain QYMF) TaxID=293826 RepID=A6TTZ0_ALKMQ|nr:TRAP transporter small permease [Alkaliphilus metalliredigens]ABR49658.1 Tripartite ATP-independent periplasmic transporter, DctQ component [Alkaliphilus metalliredigens QYMF]
MKLLELPNKASNMLDWAIVRLVFLGIVGMIAAITLQIISRVFFSAVVWTEELARYLLVWSSFLGATLAYKRKMHIAVTFGVERLPKMMQRVIVLFSILLSMLFFAVCTYYGFQLMNMQIYQVSPALGLPMKYVYLGIPLSFFVMFIHGIVMILDMFVDAKGVHE